MGGGATLAFKKPSVIPGFGLALGFTLTYLSLIVLIPLAGARPEDRDARLAGILADRDRPAHASPRSSVSFGVVVRSPPRSTPSSA